MSEEGSKEVGRGLVPAGLVGPIIAVLQVSHWGIVLYSMLGWLADTRLFLILYLIWLPALNVQWFFNQNSCIINNLESWLRGGRWRDQRNEEEGAFIHTAVKRYLKIDIGPRAFDILIRVIMVILWFVALSKLRAL